MEQGHEVNFTQNFLQEITDSINKAEQVFAGYFTKPSRKDATTTLDSQKKPVKEVFDSWNDLSKEGVSLQEQVKQLQNTDINKKTAHECYYTISSCGKKLHYLETDCSWSGYESKWYGWATVSLHIKTKYFVDALNILRALRNVQSVAEQCLKTPQGHQFPQVISDLKLDTVWCDYQKLILLIPQINATNNFVKSMLDETCTENGDTWATNINDEIIKGYNNYFHVCCHPLRENEPSNERSLVTQEQLRIQALIKATMNTFNKKTDITSTKAQFALFAFFNEVDFRVAHIEKEIAQAKRSSTVQQEKAVYVKCLDELYYVQERLVDKLGYGIQELEKTNGTIAGMQDILKTLHIVLYKKIDRLITKIIEQITKQKTIESSMETFFDPQKEIEGKSFGHDLVSLDTLLKVIIDNIDKRLNLPSTLARNIKIIEQHQETLLSLISTKMIAVMEKKPLQKPDEIDKLQIDRQTKSKGVFVAVLLQQKKNQTLLSSQKVKPMLTRLNELRTLLDKCRGKTEKANKISSILKSGSQHLKAAETQLKNLTAKLQDTSENQEDIKKRIRNSKRRFTDCKNKVKQALENREILESDIKTIQKEISDNKTPCTLLKSLNERLGTLLATLDGASKKRRRHRRKKTNVDPSTNGYTSSTCGSWTSGTGSQDEFSINQAQPLGNSPTSDSIILLEEEESSREQSPLQSLNVFESNANNAIALFKNDEQKEEKEGKNNDDKNQLTK